MSKGRLHTDLHPRSFKSLWAEGQFDDCDYFALTAPLDTWSAEIPMHCMSEAAGEIAEPGWGVVACRLVVYVYSSEARASERARMLGSRVKPLKLRCLQCFCRALSTHYAYVDMILDESWHLEAFTCRESQTSQAGCSHGGVSHVRLRGQADTFQLLGCAGRGDLRWDHYREYGDPHFQEEWCRPISFPQGYALYDHSLQGGPMDGEAILPAESLEYFVVDDVLLARDSAGDSALQTLYARPTGPLAFADLGEEKVRLTNGEGVWFPIAWAADGPWQTYPWAGAFQQVLARYAALKEPPEPAPLRRDGHWYLNQAMATLEAAFLATEEVDEEDRAEAVKSAREMLERGLTISPGHWYARHVYCEVCRSDLAELPAVVHADRIIWLSSTRNRQLLDAEFAAATKSRPNHALALYNYAVTLIHLEAEEDGIACLRRLLAVDPHHAQALFELALVAMRAGDEEEEMRLYAECVKADPTFALPYYNMGKTYEDRGEVEEAKVCYAKAIEHMPHYVEALEQLAGMAHEEGNIDKAAEYIGRALHANPRRITTYEKAFGFAAEAELPTLDNMALEMLKDHMPREYRGMIGD